MTLIVFLLEKNVLFSTSVFYTESKKKQIFFNDQHTENAEAKQQKKSISIIDE